MSNFVISWGSFKDLIDYVKDIDAGKIVLTDAEKYVVCQAIDVFMEEHLTLIKNHLSYDEALVKDALKKDSIVLKMPQTSITFSASDKTTYCLDLAATGYKTQKALLEGEGTENWFEGLVTLKHSAFFNPTVAEGIVKRGAPGSEFIKSLTVTQIQTSNSKKKGGK
jgi:hypothetical protein